MVYFGAIQTDLNFYVKTAPLRYNYRKLGVYVVQLLTQHRHTEM